MVRTPEYATVKEVADWLRVDINANTDPNTSMVENFIMDNEDLFNTETGHSWLVKSQYQRDTFDVSDIYDYGRGLYIPLKHRELKPFDSTQGDKFEIWDGQKYVEQVVTLPDIFLNFDEVKGVMYIRGFIYTILRKSRFRVTYRYGGTKEVVDGVTNAPRDIRKAVKLMTCIDILTTDFKMSQIAYGGEGNVDKASMIDKWQKMIDKTIWNHNEIQVVW